MTAVIVAIVTLLTITTSTPTLAQSNNDLLHANPDMVMGAKNMKQFRNGEALQIFKKLKQFEADHDLSPSHFNKQDDSTSIPSNLRASLVVRQVDPPRLEWIITTTGNADNDVQDKAKNALKTLQQTMKADVEAIEETIDGQRVLTLKRSDKPNFHIISRTIDDQHVVTIDSLDDPLTDFDSVEQGYEQSILGKGSSEARVKLTLTESLFDKAFKAIRTSGQDNLIPGDTAFQNYMKSFGTVEEMTGTVTLSSGGYETDLAIQMNEDYQKGEKSLLYLDRTVLNDESLFVLGHTFSSAARDLLKTRLPLPGLRPIVDGWNGQIGLGAELKIQEATQIVNEFVQTKQPPSPKTLPFRYFVEIGVTDWPQIRSRLDKSPASISETDGRMLVASLPENNYADQVTIRPPASDSGSVIITTLSPDKLNKRLQPSWGVDGFYQTRTADAFAQHGPTGAPEPYRTLAGINPTPILQVLYNVESARNKAAGLLLKDLYEPGDSGFSSATRRDLINIYANDPGAPGLFYRMSHEDESKTITIDLDAAPTAVGFGGYFAIPYVYALQNQLRSQFSTPDSANARSQNHVQPGTEKAGESTGRNPGQAAQDRQQNSRQSP